MATHKGVELTSWGVGRLRRLIGLQDCWGRGEGGASHLAKYESDMVFSRYRLSRDISRYE